MKPTTVITVRKQDRAKLLADPEFVYVGRMCAGWQGSLFGNPYTVASHGQEKAFDMFQRELTAAVRGEIIRGPFPERFKVMAARLHELRGKRLGCWCGCWEPGQTLKCHAVALAQAAELAGG